MVFILHFEIILFYILQWLLLLYMVNDFRYPQTMPIRMLKLAL